jgi:hypothetical protein
LKVFLIEEGKCETIIGSRYEILIRDNQQQERETDEYKSREVLSPQWPREPLSRRPKSEADQIGEKPRPAAKRQRYKVLGYGDHLQRVSASTLLLYKKHSTIG